MLKEDLRRAFISPMFVVAILCFCASRCYLAFPEYIFSGRTVMGLFHYEELIFSTQLNELSIASSCLPFAMCYMEDRKYGLLPYVFTREKAASYAVSKVFVVWLSAVVTAVIAYLTVFFLFYIINAGVLTTEYTRAPLYVFGQMLFEHPILYFASLISLNAMQCAVWVVAAFVATCFVKDLFIVIAVSYLSFVYVMRLLAIVLHLGAFVPTRAFGGALMRDSTNMLPAYLGSVLQILAVTVVFAAIAVLKIRRDYRHA